MYRPGKPPILPSPYGPPPSHLGSPFRLGGPCGIPPPRHQNPGPYSAPRPESPFLHSRLPTGSFIRPPCSSYPVDCNTAIPSGSRPQNAPPADPSKVPKWTSNPVKPPVSDNSDQAGEEFLRCIAANKPLPDYLKGNMAYNLADAFKSASILQKAVKSDPEFQKHVTRSKSRSHSHGRSRGRSRGKSRGRSRGRSCGRSRGRSHGKSRAKSEARSKSRACSRSRGRSKSRIRGKSRVKGKSRDRSNSQNRSNKSHIQSKSRVRRSKSRSSSKEKSKDRKRKRSRSHSSSRSISNLAGSSLLEGLKLVISNKELESRLPDLKDAILTIQASGNGKKGETSEDKQQQNKGQEDSTAIDNDSMLLPHERVGSEFSWLQAQSQEESAAQKPEEFEDEESFLYGNGEPEKSQEKPSQSQNQNSSVFSSLQLSSFNLASLDSSECEKVRNILKGLGSTDLSKMMEDKQQDSALSASEPAAAAAAALALPALNNPNIRQALESLQSLIKATKEKRAKTDSSDTSSGKQKVGDSENKEDKHTQMKSLMNQLEELLKQDGLSCLTPVIGFYCKKCEEFIGDLKTAESHAAEHRHSNSSQKGQSDWRAGDATDRHSSGKRDHRDHDSRRDAGDPRNHNDHKRERTDDRGHKSRHENEHRIHRSSQESIFLKEEMMKERMLITVSRGLTPPLNVQVKEEVDRQKANRGITTKENVDRTGEASKEGRGKDKQGKDEVSDSDGDKGRKRKAKSPRKYSESSDSSDFDKDKKSKRKSPKKKKKEKKRKKHRGKKDK